MFETVAIAGSAARGADPVTDARFAAALLASVISDGGAADVGNRETYYLGHTVTRADVLLDQFEVTVESALIERAARSVQRMIDLPPPTQPARYDLVKARHHVDVEMI